MDWKILRNDSKKNAWRNAILLSFICMSAAIAGAVVLMLVQLFGSIHSMYEIANPPHFLQMHKGEFSYKSLAEFQKKNEAVKHWQVVSMINLSGEEITISDKQEKRFTLKDCKLDLGFVKQNTNYDVLLDEFRNPAHLKKGEIGVPVILMDKYNITLGDTVELSGNGIKKSFVVSTIIYDGQMNSTLCSSTRFLLSDDDFQEMLGKSKHIESLIEVWFEDSSTASAYQMLYEQSDDNLPKNGQAITYTILFLLSALTDLLTAMVFLLAGLFLIGIVLICLKYVILAELEEDKVEIGTMKAIGISHKGIRNLYLTKIKIISLLGVSIGITLAPMLSSLIGQRIQRTFGRFNLGHVSLIYLVAVSLAVYWLIVFYTANILKRMKKLSITELMFANGGFGRTYAVRHRLHRIKRLKPELVLGFYEARRGYGILFVTLLLVSFFIVVPLRTAETMEDASFVTYMGSPIMDVLLEVEEGDDLEQRNQLAYSVLQGKHRQKHIKEFSRLRRIYIPAQSATNELVGIHIDHGKQAGKGLHYLSGTAPETEQDIAISYLTAQELNMSTGDTVRLIHDDEVYALFVCGIYQDITGGGKSAKTLRDFPAEKSEKYSYHILVASHSNIDNISTELQKQLGFGYNIEQMEAFIEQTMGGVTRQIRGAALPVCFIGFAVSILITVLFMKLRITRNAGEIAAKMAMGIPFSAIFLQEIYSILFAGGFGTIMGCIFAEVFGDSFIGGIFSFMGLGLQKIEFTNASVVQFTALPIALLLSISGMTFIVCSKIRKIKPVAYLNS